MNYYERYCGDYARDTCHLSLQEHGAYTVMLDTYYATETPLPADYKALYRICRAMTGQEREATRRVADEFFPVSQDGLRHNNRADEVIAKARKRIEAAKVNGGRGGRPQKEPTGLFSENPVGFPEEPSGHIGTSTRPHVPTEPKSKALSGKPDFPPNGRDYNAESKDVLAYLNRTTGRVYRAVDSNLKLIAARLKSGVSVVQMKEVVLHKFDQWKGDAKMDEYLRPATLFNATKFEQYLGEISGMPQVQ